MAQNTVDLSADYSGTQTLDVVLTNLVSNFETSHSGSARPSYVKAGMVWIDTTSSPWVWKCYNGTNDIVIGNLDESGLTFTPSQTSSILNNYTATTDPTVNDDAGDGYVAGSRWFNTTDSDLFICIDNSAGAAVWFNTGLDLTDLGSAATKDVGIAVGEIPLLQSNGGNIGFAALDGSLLTNLPESGGGNFGSWATRVENTAYLAATDGYLVCLGVIDSSWSGNRRGYIAAYTDANASPTTIRAGNHIQGHPNANYPSNAVIACSTPVKSGDYYKGNFVDTNNSASVEVSRTYYWIPIE